MRVKFRRRIVTIFLILLCGAFFWKDLLSLALQGVVRYQLACQIDYREIHFQNSQIILSDVLFIDHFENRSLYHVRSDHVSIGIEHLHRPINIRVILDHPHFAFFDDVFLQGRKTFRKKNRWIQTSVTIENGSFAWHHPNKNPLFGKVTYSQKKLDVQIGNSSITAQRILKGKDSQIDCSFQQLDIEPFSEHFLPFHCKGLLTGSLLIDDGASIFSVASGKISIENLFFESVVDQIKGGASQFKWEGEYHYEDKQLDGLLNTILSFPDRMKIQWVDGFLERKSSQLSNLRGSFSSNPNVGLYWEINGDNFLWEGKGFNNSLSTNWLESKLSLDETNVSFVVTKKSIDRTCFSLDLEKMSAKAFTLLKDFWPSLSSIGWNKGSLSAQIAWDQTKDGYENWNIENLIANEIAIQGSDWRASCENIHAKFSSQNNWLSGSLELSLHGGSININSIDISSLFTQCQVIHGAIVQSNFNGNLNGLEVSGDVRGEVNRIVSNVLLKGQWAKYWFWQKDRYSSDISDVVETTFTIQGNENSFLTNIRANFPDSASIDAQAQIVRQEGGWLVSDAEMVSHHVDLSYFQPILPLGCLGKGDLKIHFHEEELDLEGALSHFLLKTDFGELLIDELGHLKPFEAGLKAKWNQKTNEWSALTTKAFCEYSIHETKIPLCAECELSGKGSNNCQIRANLSNIHWGPFDDGKAIILASTDEGLIECQNLEANVKIGNASFPFHMSEMRKLDDEWIFDCSLAHHFLDLGRLAGTFAIQDRNLLFTIDATKSHLFNSSINLKTGVIGLDGTIRDLDLSYDLKLDQLLAVSSAIDAIDPSMHSWIHSSVRGGVQCNLNLSTNQPSIISCEGKEIFYKGKEIPFHLQALQKTEGWQIERFQLNALDVSCLISVYEQGWKIQNSMIKWRDSMSACANGYLTEDLKCELNLDHLTIDLQKAIAPFIWEKLDGKLEGQGAISLEWNQKLFFEANLDLIAKNMKSGELLIDNDGPMKVNFSYEKGLFIHGLNLQICRDLEWPNIYARIGMMEFDFTCNHWVLHHAQMKLPTDFLSTIQQKLSAKMPIASWMNALDSSHDLEFFADIDCAMDLSSLTLSMREGFIPFLGAVRHLQNVYLNWDSQKMFLSFSALQEEHPIKFNSAIEFTPHPRGSIFLEDEELSLSPQERPLTIEWEIEPQKGLTIHSVEGTFNGIEASFHAQSSKHLVGSARLNFGLLSEIVPPKLKGAFRQMQLGKGFELKGKIFYDPQNISDISFRGLFSGKQCEVFGIQLRTLLAQVEFDSSRMHCFELKASDSAGILQIEDLLIHRKGDSSFWNLSMPQMKLIEFRPSLLQKLEKESSNIKPLVVRELKLQDLKGQLNDPNTFTAKGRLSFVNSFKREHTVFDLPSDFFGRLIGLDAELMIPVQGKLKFELKEGKFWLSDLQDAFSEGRRSKFFLVKEGLSPTIDLNGNLHIFVTMKQYVLFKITENFLLTIDGSIASPSFHLQKKSKLLGL